MLSFRQYRQSKSVQIRPVLETTIPDHLSHIPEDLSESHYHTFVSDSTREKMHSTLGGKGFTSFPLNDDDHAANDDVVEHLANHGYSVKDYRKGIAHKLTTVGNPDKGIPLRQKMVEEKIGSVLDKTQAPDHVKKSYMNDGSRTGFKAPRSDSLHVLVSTTPHAIAGMSTGTPWHSCTNLVSGSNKAYLRSDMEHGTHVAYLVRHDDPTAFKTGAPTHPLARIALKPFHHEDDHDDVIFRSDSKDYGSGGDKFRTAVDEWAHKSYPADVGATYNRNESVLNNTGDAERFTHVTHEDAIQNIENGYGVDGNRGKTYMTHDTTSKVLNHFVKKVKETGHGTNEIRDLIEGVNLAPSHVKTVLGLISEGHPKLLYPLVKEHGQKFSKSAIEKHYGDNNSQIPMNIVRNPNVPDHMVDKFNHYQLSEAAPSKVRQHHIDKLVDDFTNSKGVGLDSHTLAKFSPKFSSENISKIVKISRYVPGVTENSNFSKEHHDTWLKNLEEPVAKMVLGSSKHTSLSDAKVDGQIVPSRYKSLIYNEKTPKSTQHEIKNHILDSVKKQSTDLGSDDNKWESRFNLYSGDGYISHRDQSEIPHNISQHFTKDDYDTIAKTGKIPKFEHAEHSARLLDSYRSIATQHDNKLSQHIDDQREEKGIDHDEFYHEDEDHEAQGLRKTLHRHMARYGAALEDHYNEHVRDTGNGTGELKNLKQHENVGDHIESLQNMGAYYSHHNNHLHPGTQDVEEHHWEHFGEVEDLHNQGERQKDENRSLHW